MFGYYKTIRKIKSFFDRRNLEFNIDIETFNHKIKDELIIFGNGYTLNGADLKDFTGEDCFVCNEFYLMNNFKEFILNNNVLYFMNDGLGSIHKQSKIDGLDWESTFLKYNLMFLNMSDITFVQPESLAIEYLKCNANIRNIVSQSLVKSILKDKPNKIKYLVNDINLGHTPQVMLLVGILLGYKKIHLHGLEHNYVKDILNKDPKCGTHFYGESYREVLELNDGKGLPREAYRVTLSKLFEGNAKTFKGYEQLADLAKELGVEVIDHSNGSLFMFQDYSLWDLVEPKNTN
jgi:hypothetical protein